MSGCLFTFTELSRAVASHMRVRGMLDQTRVRSSVWLDPRAAELKGKPAVRRHSPHVGLMRMHVNVDLCAFTMVLI